MAKKVFYLISVFFIVMCGLTLYIFNTCNNVFQSKLVDSSFSSMVVHSDQGEEIISDTDEVEAFIKKVNQCPRRQSGAMSFEEPGRPIILIHEESQSTEELAYFNTTDMQLLYGGYLIDTDLDFEEFSQK